MDRRSEMVKKSSESFFVIGIIVGSSSLVKHERISRKKFKFMRNSNKAQALVAILHIETLNMPDRNALLLAIPFYRRQLCRHIFHPLLSLSTDRLPGNEHSTEEILYQGYVIGCFSNFWNPYPTAVLPVASH